jgi:hypothetical protein
MSHPNNYLVYKSGMSSVGQYQMSSIPYMTSSVTVPVVSATPLEISFPRITKFITVRNVMPTGSSGKVIRVGFSSNGTAASVGGEHWYFKLAPGESYTGEWRVKSVFLLSDSAVRSTASIIAGLTSVSTSSLGFNNWTGSIGV